MSDESNKSDARLTMRRSENLPDWYTIEFAEHEGREWFEPIVEDGREVGAAPRMSCRPSDADIEGTSHEMTMIARAIRAGQSATFKRCAAQRTRDGLGYAFSSPRNSQREHVATLAAATALADEILAPFHEDTRPPKERAYDEHVSPLIAQVVAACKAHGINAFLDFGLGVDASGEYLCCTTRLVVDEADERGADRVLRAEAAVSRQLVILGTVAPVPPSTPKGDPQ